MDPRDEVQDELLGRVIDELRTLPEVGEADARRIAAVAMAAARDASEDEDDASPVPARGARSWFGARRVPFAWAAGVAFLAGAAGFLSGRVGGRAAPAVAVSSPAPAAATSASTPATLAPVANETAGELAPRLTQFVLDAPAAARVALVGDFNGWDAAATPLVRGPGGMWTATIAMTPGRHVYAFMVDDTVLTLDPRAPETRDPDLGTRASVVLVGAR